MPPQTAFAWLLPLSLVLPHLAVMAFVEAHPFPVRAYGSHAGPVNGAAVGALLVVAAACCCAARRGRGAAEPQATSGAPALPRPRRRGWAGRICTTPPPRSRSPSLPDWASRNTALCIRRRSGGRRRLRGRRPHVDHMPNTRPAMGPRDTLDLLHPWHEGYFPHRGRHYATIQGAYEAHRGGAYRPSYEDLTGGQAWARSALSTTRHDFAAYRTAVESKFRGHLHFRSTVLSARDMHVWHQETALARLHFLILRGLRAGPRSRQTNLFPCE